MGEEKDKLEELGFASPQQSIAKGIERLSSKDRILLMSVIKGRDVFRYSLMYLFASELGWDFLKDLADYMLQLNVSVKGLGRAQVVEVVRNQSERGGALSQMKEKISSFIRSE